MSPRCSGCRYIGESLTRRWELILPVCGGTSALDRRAILTARCLHEPRAISNHPVGLGFQHTPGQYRPGECAFSSLIFWGNIYMCANFRPGDVSLSSPCAAGPRPCTEGQHPHRASSMSLGQLAITQCDWGFHTLRGGIDPGDVHFCPQFVWVVDIHR